MPRPENVSPYHQFSFASTIPSVQNKSQARTHVLSLVTPVAVLNMLLFAFVGGLVLYYVLQANAIASNQYTMKSLNEEVQSLSEVRMELAQQQAELADASLLVLFAAERNMVAAKDASYLFESSNVAYHR
jgi:hypothetical protein